MDDLKLLIVDDEQDFISTLIKRIKKRCIKVAGVARGREALEFLARESVDVVVLDVRMPGMDGLETLKRIKAGYPLIEVVMLTGHASVEVAIQGMEAGAFDYLMKPMDIDELLFKVRDAFEKKRVQEKKIERVGL
jgi:DNA-binding NtrC family response regulator